MKGETEDLRGCPTAFECRDRLPELSRWMEDDLLKELPIWQKGTFDRGKEYFDLDNPDRGPFVAGGDEGPITDHTYVCRDDATERAWAELVTWRQPVSRAQGEAIEMNLRELGAGRERSAAGEGRPLPPI